jgi:hypothetical protein
MLTTDYLHNRQFPGKYDVQAPYLYALERGSHWLTWTRGYTFDLPHEKFNAESIANAAALYDWRKYDGYYYLIYAGRSEGQAYAKRGWNQIALARSKGSDSLVGSGRMSSRRINRSSLRYTNENLPRAGRRVTPRPLASNWTRRKR